MSYAPPPVGMYGSGSYTPSPQPYGGYTAYAGGGYSGSYVPSASYTPSVTYAAPSASYAPAVTRTGSFIANPDAYPVATYASPAYASGTSYATPAYASSYPTSGSFTATTTGYGYAQPPVLAPSGSFTAYVANPPPQMGSFTAAYPTSVPSFTSVPQFQFYAEPTGAALGVGASAGRPEGSGVATPKPPAPTGTGRPPMPPSKPSKPHIKASTKTKKKKSGCC